MALSHLPIFFIGDDGNSVQFFCLSACQRRVAYNRRALKVYVTKVIIIIIIIIIKVK
jgi:hypothetical protein